MKSETRSDQLRTSVRSRADRVPGARAPFGTRVACLATAAIVLLPGRWAHAVPGDLCFSAATSPLSAPDLDQGDHDAYPPTRPAFVDIDSDGELDAFQVSEGGDYTWFATNIGTPTTPSFGPYQTNPFGLAGAPGGLPELSDIDGDGDLDFFLVEWDGSIRLAENVGTALSPSFTAFQTNPFGLTSVPTLPGFAPPPSPTLADIDGDGDLDLFVGTTDGSTRFFENTGTSLAPAFAAPMTNPFGLADVGEAASLDLADIDGDGDLDAVLGSGNHITFEEPEAVSTQVLFYENIGTSVAPAFGATPISALIGLDGGDFFLSASPRIVDIDADGDLDLFVGRIGDPVHLFFEGGDCAGIVCGDGEIDLGEQCDDGNTIDGDCCSSSCILEGCGGPNCANGTVDFGEQCDDGNTIDGDCCSSSCTNEPAGPAALPCVGVCDGSGGLSLCSDGWDRAQLLVSEVKPGKEKLIAKLIRGPELSAADFGDPTLPGGPAYDLRVCDDQGDLVAELKVDRAGDLCGTKDCWKPIGPLGFSFKDADASSDGVNRITLKGGPAGKSQIQLKAKNNANKGQLSLPTGIASALSGSSGGVTLSLFGSNDVCFSTTIPGVVKNDGVTFKAKK